MSVVKPMVVGIDVGGERKGFHAVALQNGTFVATLAHSDPAVIVSWCRQLKAVVVAVDAPCGWSAGGASVGHPRGYRSTRSHPVASET